MQMIPAWNACERLLHSLGAGEDAQFWSTIQEFKAPWNAGSVFSS